MTSAIQSLVFKKDRFTAAQAQAWAEVMGYEYRDVDEKTGTWRIRQFEPDRDYTYKSRRLAKGVIGVVATLKPSWKDYR